MSDKNEVAMGDNGKNIFLTINGMKIAKRENHQWTSLVPGYKVRDYGDMDGISVEVDPSCSHSPTTKSHRMRGNDPT